MTIFLIIIIIFLALTLMDINKRVNQQREELDTLKKRHDYLSGVVSDIEVELYIPDNNNIISKHQKRSS